MTFNKFLFLIISILPMVSAFGMQEILIPQYTRIPQYASLEKILLVYPDFSKKSAQRCQVKVIGIMEQIYTIQTNILSSEHTLTKKDRSKVRKMKNYFQKAKDLEERTSYISSFVALPIFTKIVADWIIKLEDFTKTNKIKHEYLAQFYECFNKLNEIQNETEKLRNFVKDLMSFYIVKDKDEL